MEPDLSPQPASPTQRGESSVLSPDAAVKRYRIGDKNYRIEPASYRQHRWLAEGPLNGVDLSGGLSGGELQAIIREQGPEILAIVLIAEGQTREQKATAGLEAARELIESIEVCLTPEEVREAAGDFFAIDGFGNLTFFIDFRKAAASMPAATTANGSTPASVSSPEATSPSVDSSSVEADLATASRTYDGSSNGNSPI